MNVVVCLASLVVCIMFQYGGVVGQESISQQYSRYATYMTQVQQIVVADSIREELQVADYQLAKVKAIVDEFMKKYREHGVTNSFRLAQFNRGVDVGFADEASITDDLFRSVVSDAEAAEKEIEDCLLPHQKSRLEQLVLQRQLMAQVGNDRGAMLVALVNRLELSKDDLKEFSNQAKEISEKYKEKARKLAEEYEAELVQALPKEARQKVKEAVGEIVIE